MIAVLAEGDAAVVHPDDVDGVLDVRGIHNQDFIRLAVVVGVIHHDITAQLAGDPFRYRPRRIRQG